MRPSSCAKCLVSGGRSDYVARKNGALKKAASHTLRFIEDLPKATDPGEDKQFEEIIQEGARLLVRV